MMAGLHFGNPEALWLLALWPGLAVLGWLALRRRAAIARRLGDSGSLDRLYPASVRRWRRRRMMLGLLATLLLMLAAARPQYGRVEQTVRTAGTNVIVALDCSPSMRARDVEPDRLTAAKDALDMLVYRLRGNRIGVVAFAGAAFLQCPLTVDHLMAQRVLASLDTDSVGVPGTDLGEAIRVAAEAYARGGDEGSRVLVLVTDGEDHEGQALAAAREAHEAQGMVVHAIGVGTARGAPLLDDQGQFKDDPEGGKVNSRLRMDSLEALARETGGLAIEAGERPMAAINQVAASIERQKREELESRRQVVYRDRYPWFLLPALVLMLWLMLARPEPTRVG